MAERIKGLQIDLSMKDMGVQRSISEIKRSFKGLNADLKLSNNNFKYSEKSLNSYKLRTRELSLAVKESKANVAALKAKYQEVSRESGVNSKKAAQLRQEYSRQADNLNYLQNELDQTRDKYREMIAVSKSSVGRLGQTFAEIGPKIKSIGDSMKSVGRNMSMYVTAPITAGFGAAMKKSIDFDDTMRKVKATSGATGDEFNQLRTKALQMGRDTKFTASESAEAMNYMALAGWDTKDMLNGIGGVMNLAAASGEDLASVSDIVTDNLTAFGMKAKDSTHFADVLAQTSSKANTDVRGLGDAFKYAAPVAGALGYTIEDTSIAIGLMSNAGIKGEKAGTALRTMFTNLAKPTKAMKDKMDELGISITDSNGEMLPMRDVMDQLRTKMGGLSKDQQAAAASTIFGKEAMSGALAVINASDEDYKKLTKSIDGSSGASKRMANEMEGGIGGAMRKMKSAIESLAISLGDALAPILYKVATWVTKLATKFSNLPSGVQKTIAVVGLLAAAIGPLLMVFGVMVSTIGTAITTLGSLMTSMRTLSLLSKTSAAATSIWNGVTATARGIANGYRYAIAALTTSQTIQAIKTKIAAAATTVWTTVTKGAALATKGLGLAIRFMTGPVGIVITAIGLLVAGLIHLWKTNSSFRNSVITAWNAIKNSAVTIFGFIKTYIVAIWNAIKASTIAVWNGIKTVAVATWNGIKLAILHPIKTLKTILSTIWNAMKNSAIKIWTALKNGVIAIIKAYVAQVKFNINLIKRIVVTIFNAIKNFSIKVWTALKNAVLGIVRTLRKGVLSVFNALKKGVSAIFNAIKNATVRIWTAMKNTVINRAKALWSGVRNTWNALKKGTIGIFKAVGSFMSSKWNSIKKGTVNKAKALWSGVKGAWGSLKKGTHNTMNAVGGFMSKKWNGIKSTTVSIVNSMKSKVMGTMNKMRDGIKTVTGKIGNLFGGMVKGVKKGLNKLISGVNWVADKLGMDKLPSIKLSTGTNASKKYVSHGKINRDTFATVGDKGRGNGPSGFRHEMIEYPNGKTTITPNRDTTTFLPKGSKVYNGTQTHAMLSQMPRFSIGSAIKEKAEYMFGKGKKSIKGTVGKGKDLGGNAVDQVKKVGSEVAVKAKKVGSAVISGIGDVFDYIGHPGKLVNKIFDKVGFNFNFLKDAPLPFDLMQGAYKKLKSGVKSLFDEWLNDAGGGDGSSFTKFPITTGYYPNGGAPGYSFGGGHHYGIDFGAPFGTTINATNSGQLGELHNFGGGLVARLLTGQFTLFFMHLSKILKHGKVQAGEPIAKTGNSGNWTTGPHLHFQVEKGRHNDITNQNTVNPLKWLKGHGGGKVGGSGSANARRAIQRAQSILGGRYKSSYITEQMMRVAKRESNFQADAVNNWDINARMGDPSKGMFQMIGSSFRAYAKPGHGNILNPTDEAISAMRYIVGKWVPIMGSWRSAFKRAGDYAYATGGVINTSGMYQLAEGGYPEIVIPTDPSRQSDAMKLLHLAASKISGNNRNKRPNQLRTPSVTSNTVDNAELLLQMIENQQKQINVLMEIARSNENIEKQPKGFSERDVSQAQGSRLRLAAYSQGGL
ncbi:phage tail tape measure protein [Staphylococcus epidermidis]|jgi:TP901 family phage tail tape measure protein|uniref:tail length tape measure protein n=1 Tax=Staphylococcus phage StB20-like TaxID=1732064 RepID=UPI000706B362|nr:phage tail tape measure protein [Staphylococcus epidermidis]YP_009200535.1 tail length tape measure protein [Staphylococcus phage StB20-like]ALH46715.1 glycyl-glycine endopeptidase ALE-1 precursor [Staphylococcus phage StB20-like]MBF8057623.1 phage tail tape measure protein [Staphylococcus epidermidis]MCG1394363.1 phage tail tape measure protein [Staphylococcus epidermidis]MCG1705243.1 phage tail tape measure protein [Staphylococcus epidermidis]MCG2090284.1 phage tail tape measure protein 